MTRVDPDEAVPVAAPGEEPPGAEEPLLLSSGPVVPVPPPVGSSDPVPDAVADEGDPPAGPVSELEVGLSGNGFL